MEVRQRPLLALGLRLIAAAIFSVMMMNVKLLGERGVTLSETIFWRQLTPAVLILAWLIPRGELARLKTRRFPIHARRAGIGIIGMYANLGAVILLPMTEATTLGFTAPVFAVILAALLLKEQVGVVRWLAVSLGLLGVVIIAGPDGSAITPLGLAVGIAAPFMVALISIQVRDLGRTEMPLATVFWFSALSAPIAAIPALLAMQAHDAATWGMLAVVGLTGTVGQLLLTTSLRLGSVSSVIVMDYSGFAWATLWGFLVFDHLPPAATWIGAPVIVAAGLIIVWREHRLHLEKAVGPVPA